MTRINCCSIYCHDSLGIRQEFNKSATYILLTVLQGVAWPPGGSKYLEVGCSTERSSWAPLLYSKL